jgi:asparagine N-glycosylation enzyme membrane subunit Stt3
VGVDAPAPELAPPLAGDRLPSGGGEAALELPGAGRGRAHAAAAWAAAALLLGAGARLVGTREVFQRGGVRFLPDGDPYYHVIRAEQIAAAWPRIPARDPWLDWPNGALAFWPPLFDLLLALPALPSAGDRAVIAPWAAVVPVLLGLATLLSIAWAARALLGGKAPWWDAALLLAAAPSHIAYSRIGRPDQHVLEALFFAAIVGTAAPLFRTAGAAARRSRLAPSGAEAALGALVALAFWNWPGSGLYVAFLVSVAAGWHVLAPAGEAVAAALPGRLARAFAAGALLLAASVASWQPSALRAFGVAALSALHPALVAAAAVACALLGAARTWLPAARWPGRLASAAGACVAPVAAALAWPSARAAIAAGLAPLARAGAWYASITEFRPLVSPGRGDVLLQLWEALLYVGGPLAAALLSVPWIVRAWRSSREPRPRLFLLAAWAALFVVLGILRVRMSLYAGLPVAVLGALAARAVGARAADRWGRFRCAASWGGHLAVVLLAAAPTPLALSRTLGFDRLPQRTDLIPMAELLGALPFPEGRPGILASWTYGHELRYFARRPVVSCQFGTEAGDSLYDEVSFAFASEPREVMALLDRRRVGHVFANNPFASLAQLRPFAPAGALEYVVHVETERGYEDRYDERIFALVSGRLFFRDGNGDPQAAPIDRLRLVAESPTFSRFQGLAFPLYKAFAVVEGALLRVSGAAPGATVTAEVALRTPAGRNSRWVGRAVADGAGAAEIRVPYATGANGRVVASGYAVSDGVGEAAASVAEEDVVGGRVVPVRLRSVQPSR